MKLPWENVEILKKYHALEETVLLELVIVVQKLKGVKKQNIFITQM